ncbi:(2Fe-2S)-binding protein [bacterium]|nr:(2Fe-2S)-binding protein [bacterium]
MNKIIHFKLDGVDCQAEKGQYILDAAAANGIWIPSLCNMKGIKPHGSCRICTVKVNGRPMTACTTPVVEGMVVESNTEELNDQRKQILEMLFVEGNHFCPACERSGNCELQALVYRFRVAVPRFAFQFPVRNLDASNPRLIKDHNRCILCKRCIRGIKDKEGRNLFAFRRRGHKVEISLDPELAGSLTDEQAQKAMDICPVGALIRKEKGFDVPIGKRTYDKKPIGSEVEQPTVNE